MGGRPKQTFLQRRHTDGQEAHEKLLNNTNSQRNANQNYNDVSLHTGRNGHHQKKSTNNKWEKIFANHISDKGGDSKIYKELIQLNSKKNEQSN